MELLSVICLISSTEPLERGLSLLDTIIARLYVLANGLLRAAHVSHDKVGRQRVESPGDTLHRTVEALQVDGHVGSVLVGQWWMR